MKKLIVGNWKMNPQKSKEAEILYKTIQKNAKDTKGPTIVVCPPFPYLYLGQKFKSKLLFGAQDVATLPSGASTGEVSAMMLSSINVSYVIVGHSERRAFGESNTVINQKILQSLKAKLMPILCIGESIRDSEGHYLSFIKMQLQECLAGVSKAQLSNIAIAYEPVWAIGKDALREATPEEFTETKIFIKKVLADMYDIKTAHNIPIIYGGSVHPNNAKQFLNAFADGLLIGRDSLSPSKFQLILKATQ